MAAVSVAGVGSDIEVAGSVVSVVDTVVVDVSGSAGIVAGSLSSVDEAVGKGSIAAIGSLAAGADGTGFLIRGAVDVSAGVALFSAPRVRALVRVEVLVSEVGTSAGLLSILVTCSFSGSGAESSGLRPSSCGSAVVFAISVASVVVSDWGALSMGFGGTVNKRESSAGVVSGDSSIKGRGSAGFCDCEGALEGGARGRAEGTLGLKAGPPFFLNMELMVGYFVARLYSIIFNHLGNIVVDGAKPCRICWQKKKLGGRPAFQHTAMVNTNDCLQVGWLATCRKRRGLAELRRDKHTAQSG